jgi:AraC-like DNA-binding protein
MSPDDAVSSGVLAFIQESQVAVRVCADEDYVAQVSALWSCLASFPRQAAGCDQVAATATVCRIAMGFLAFSDHAESPRPSHASLKSQRQHVNALLRLTRENYSRADLTLSGLAKELHLSLAYLSRALAAETGHSFRAHLNGIRLLAAVARLHLGTSSLREIAEQVGYPNTGELDRQFNRRFRLAPGRFRALLRLLPMVCSRE